MIRSGLFGDNNKRDLCAMCTRCVKCIFRHINILICVVVHLLEFLITLGRQ